MRGLLSLAALAAGLSGCDWIERRVDWLDRRRSPELLHLTPQEQQRLARPANHTHYHSDVTPRQCWQIHTSLSDRPHLIDGDPGTLSASSSPSQAGQWIMLDLGRDCCFQQVIQDHTESTGFPCRYRIDVAGHEGYPYHIAFVGNGTPGRSVAVLQRPVRARFIRITALDDAEHPWDVSELRIW